MFIDDKIIGRIRNGQTIEFDLEEGRHDVYVKTGWLTSKRKQVLIEEGHTTHLVLEMARGGLIFFIAPTLGFARFKGFFILCEEDMLVIKGIPHIFEIVSEKKS